MSSNSNLTSRQSLDKEAAKAESLALPRWDRHGNLISSPKRPAADVKVENVEEQVKLPTVAELEKITEQAYNEGFEQGYEQGLAQGQKKGIEQGHAEGFAKGESEGQQQGMEKGYQEALEKGRIESQKKIDLFTAVAESMQQQLAQEEEDLKEAVLALSLRIAKQVLHEELAVNQSHIKSIVQAAVQALPNPDEKLSIYINSADAELVRSITQDNWRIIESNEVALGSCEIKSDSSYVEYTIDQRFDTAVSQLMTLPRQPLSEKHKAAFSEQPLADQLASETSTEQSSPHTKTPPQDPQTAEERTTGDSDAQLSSGAQASSDSESVRDAESFTGSENINRSASIDDVESSAEIAEPSPSQQGVAADQQSESVQEQAPVEEPASAELTESTPQLTDEPEHD